MNENRGFTILKKEYINKKAGEIIINECLRYKKCKFINVDFTGINLVDLFTRFINCEFISCNFHNAICNQHQFIGCRFDKDCLYVFNLGKDIGNEIIGYKLVRTSNDLFKDKYVIAKVRVPYDARRVCGTGDKCKSECVQVIDFYTLDGKKLKWNPFRKRKFYSIFDESTTYKRGKYVDSKYFNMTSSSIVQGPGIYFFTSMDAAIDYGVDMSWISRQTLKTLYVPIFA